MVLMHINGGVVHRQPDDITRVLLVYTQRLLIISRAKPHGSESSPPCVHVGREQCKSSADRGSRAEICHTRRSFTEVYREAVLQMLPSDSEKQAASLQASQLYFYLTTFDEEVRVIWPQPTLKTGRILFLSTRYLSIITVVLDLITAYALELKFVKRDSKAIMNTSPFRGSLLQTSLVDSDMLCPFLDAISHAVSFWICVYALIGGSRKALLILGSMLIVRHVGGLGHKKVVLSQDLPTKAFVIPVQALQLNFIVSSGAKIIRDHDVCMVGPDDSSTIYPIATCLDLTRTVVINFLGAIVLRPYEDLGRYNLLYIIPKQKLTHTLELYTPLYGAWWFQCTISTLMFEAGYDIDTDTLSVSFDGRAGESDVEGAEGEAMHEIPTLPLRFS
ncbi:hypothetical protein DFP72DRAFT_857364 [Ephemerocybe angulata]|uniref:DUF6533 domain-containing protein n=1 Tax=Ephemerocybe angulata TaxID=980116 RepID=A0A8H6HF05_9AGAR|nr:hypothetical protein DFP72DRAFT_857364 [Tulosesus angulatus]